MEPFISSRPNTTAGNSHMAIQGEKSRLFLGKKHCMKIMADLKLEVGGLRATNDQLESDRHRFETQVNWKGKQLEEVRIY